MEFTNIDNGGVDTITDVQRHTHFNFIIDIDKQSIMILAVYFMHQIYNVMLVLSRTVVMDLILLNMITLNMV